MTRAHVVRELALAALWLLAVAAAAFSWAVRR